jgi:hypothetical protein
MGCILTIVADPGVSLREDERSGVGIQPQEKEQVSHEVLIQSSGDPPRGDLRGEHVRFGECFRGVGTMCDRKSIDSEKQVHEQSMHHGLSDRWLGVADGPWVGGG